MSLKRGLTFVLVIAMAMILTSPVFAMSYSVRPGDTLYLLAQRYGTTVEAIQRASNVHTTWIYPGQTLQIPTGSDSASTYTVQKGDSLYLIARRLGTTVDQLRKANNLWTNNLIYPGQQLVVPGGNGQTPPAENGSMYTVVAGDSLYKIAARYGVTVAALMQANNLSGSLIYPGQQLIIPGGNDTTPPANDQPDNGNNSKPNLPPVDPGKPSADFEIVGYYVEDYNGDPSYDSLKANADKIDAIGSFQYVVDARGNLTGKNYSAAMRVAKAHHVEILALVHNLNGGGFNRYVASSVLRDANNRANLINNLYNLVRSNGYNGVNIDIENVAPQDRDYYTLFIKQLSQKFHPAGYRVTVSIPAKTWDDPNNGWSGGFDYRNIGQYADTVMIMTYDEHWASGEPGPISSIGWVRDVMKYAKAQIPPLKLRMGIPAYGYDWDVTTYSTKPLTYTQAVQQARQVGARIQWNSTAAEPHYRYGNRIVYFASKESMGQRLKLAQELGIGGIAIWRLGQEDPGFWSLVR